MVISSLYLFMVSLYFFYIFFISLFVLVLLVFDEPAEKEREIYDEILIFSIYTCDSTAKLSCFYRNPIYHTFNGPNSVQIGYIQLSLSA